jgi:DNA primase
MSITPAFLDELRNRTSLVQVVGRKVMWDNRKSNQGKGDMWSPCPFHHEKTASFHVDDQKGFYYCFGCHAKGDAINFVQETENVSFVEAVKILADEAGLAMPDRDPRAQQKADKRATLADVMEQAVQFYRMALKTAAGAEARAYLERRGLTGADLDRWEIGFAPDGWQHLWDALKSKNVPDELILGAGLAKPSNKGKAPYDTFRNRIMFPIRDARGRAIAFGGRAMDPNDNAKYLNSPETDLFDKGRSLYNHGPARQAAGKGQPLIVAEGYMDVIALSDAGFEGAVAPLGTAITENQLHMLWRISPEPIIALDGDKAGIRAGQRLIDLALPLMEAGQSLRFALMPDGQDPDDLIKAKGPKAVQAVLDQARPMVDLLWEREIEGKNFDSPERKAALDKALREKIKLIKDPSIRAHYGQAIKDLRWKLFRPTAGGNKGGAFRPGQKGRWAPSGAKGTTKASLLVSADEARQRHMREAVIMAAIIATPAILDEFDEGLERLTCEDHDHRFLRDLLLRQAHRGVHDLRSVIEDAMGPEALDFLMAHPHVRIAPPVRRPGDVELARQTVSEELQKLTAEAGWQAELAEAQEDLHDASDEAVTWRLGQAAEARNRALRSMQEDSAEYEVGDNGAPIDKDERAALDALMERIGFAKPER